MLILSYQWLLPFGDKVTHYFAKNKITVIKNPFASLLLFTASHCMRKKAGKGQFPCPLFFAINKLACSIRLLHHDLLTVMNIQSLCRWLTAETAPCRSYHAAADSSFITLNTSLIEVVSPSPKFSTKALAPLVSRSPAEMPLCCRRWPRLPSAPLRY